MMKEAEQVEMDVSIVILPQKVLSNQICSECCNYLSIGPVMVYQGKKICGRCTVRDSKEKACVSLYDKIAEDCIFKCVNHYSGCKEVLAYNEAIDHEKTCKKEDLKCPHCEFKGNGCQLAYHFKNKHPKHTAEDNVFPILLEPGCCIFMFAENDDLLFIKITKTEKNIHISDLLGAHDDLKYFELMLFNPYSPVQYVTPKVQTNTNWNSYKQQGTSLPLGPIMNCFPSGKCMVKVNLMHGHEDTSKQMKWLQKSTTAKMMLKSITDSCEFGESVKKNDLLFDHISAMNTVDLKKFVCTKLSNLQLCVNCGKYLIDMKNIFFCLSHHMACESCSYKKCQKCNDFSQWSKFNDDSLSLECDWEGCGKHANIMDFLLHKQRCPHRRYQCPVRNCRYNACLADFKKHWHLTPYKYASNKAALCGNSACYWFVQFCNEFVHVTIERSDKMITVHVNEEQVVLSHAYDVDITYYLRKSGYVSLSQQKWEYSQSGLARTLISPIPDDDYGDTFYLSFLKKF